MMIKVTDAKVEILAMAAADLIEHELSRLYYNKTQKEYESPFQNTAAVYSNPYITIKAYDWSEENKINLKTDIVQLAWYKHSHRGLVVYVKDGWIPEKAIAEMLYEAIKSIKIDFDETIY